MNGDPRLSIGGNLPPGPLPIMVVDGLAADLAEAWRHKIARRDDLLVGFERFLAATAIGIHSDEVQGRAGDFAKQLKGEAKICENLREDVKRPVLEATRIVDGFWREITDPLRKAANTIETRMTIYAQEKAKESRRAAEEERRRREAEAARLAAEAERTRSAEAMDRAIQAEQEALEAPAAPVKPADASRVHGDLGSVSSLRGTWTYRVTDKLALIRAVAAGEVSVDALDVSDAYMKFQIKQNKTQAAVPGVEFYRDEKVIVR